MRRTTRERTAEQKRRANVAVLDAALAMVESNLRSATGSERERIQGELDAIREQLRSLGA